MFYLVFDTEVEAIATERSIFELAKAIAKAMGYKTNGLIYGKKNGISTEENAGTDCWCEIKTRLDGKFLVVHPMHSPHYADYQSQIDALIYGLTVEQSQPDWWPVEEEESTEDEAGSL